MNDIVRKLNEQFRQASAQQVLRYFLEHYRNKIAFATSMGAEDQVITHMLIEIDPAVKIFTLDTGRLFPETYDLIARTNARFRTNIRIYFPDRDQVEEMVNQKGINLFYESIENRKLCCHIRKIVPLKRALEGMEVWISGLRRSQSVTRKDMEMVEWDDNHQIIKVNPLIHWTNKEVWDYIQHHRIPYNPLHDQGFASIGCQPCTRAIKPGEDIRAGRWWWEQPEYKECGLHVKNTRME